MIKATSDKTRALTTDSLLVTVREMLRDCRSNEELFTSLLDFCAKSFQPLVARCDFRNGEERTALTRANVRIDAEVCRRFQDDFLAPANVRMQQSSPAQPELRGFDSGDGPELAMVVAPLLNIRTGATDGAISMVVSDSHGQSVHVLARLDAIVALMSAVRTSHNTMAQVDRHAGAIQNVSDCQSVNEFAFGIVNSLCNRLQCEQVGFGLERNQRIELLAVSGLPKFKSSSPGIAVHRQAMEECLDAKRVISHQPDSHDEIFPMHRTWSLDTGSSCVVSVPLEAGDDTPGVISLRRPAAHPFTSQEIENVCRIVQPYGSAVRLLERATAPLSSQVGRAVRATIRKNRTPVRIACWLTTVGILVWFAFGTMVYRPMCNSTVVSANLRTYTAALSARLDRVHVKPGAMVKSGQLLVEFDVRQQTLEVDSLRAQHEQASISHRDALQKGDVNAAALYQARLNVIAAQSGALNEQIQRARFYAPSDGVVVQADLDRRIGQVFPQGEQVLQFAPSAGWRLEIRVPDSVASHVKTGQLGQFSASARPTESMRFELDQVDGSASVVDGHNVFVARAPLQGEPKWMLNGMQGYARIETESQPVWWVASHGIIDWFRTAFWL